MSFQSLGLSTFLTSRLKTLSLSTPTPIQAVAIGAIIRRLPPSTHSDPKWGFCREGLVVDSFTGSGKTLAYLLPLLDLAMSRRGLSSMIVVPSMTLAGQIQDQVQTILGPGYSQVIDPDLDIGSYNTTLPIVIGQLKSLTKLPAGQLSTLQCIVLDEADMILKPPTRYEPFNRRRRRSRKRQVTIDGIRCLLGETAPQRAVDIDDGDEENFDTSKAEDSVLSTMDRIPPLFIAVSATSNSPLRHALKVNEIVHRTRVLSPPSSPSPKSTAFDLPPTLSHRYALLSKFCPSIDQDAICQAPDVFQLASCVKNLVAQNKPCPTLVIAPSGLSLQSISLALEHEEISVINIDEVPHQQQAQLKSPSSTDGCRRLFIGSEYSCRGLDLPAIEHVIILDLPSAAGDYVHLAGRTARLGRHGTATTIIYGPKRVERLQLMAKQLGITINHF